MKWIIVLVDIMNERSGVEYYFAEAGRTTTKRWCMNLDSAARFRTRKDADFYFRNIKKEYLSGAVILRRWAISE